MTSKEELDKAFEKYIQYWIERLTAKQKEYIIKHGEEWVKTFSNGK